ncbi:hypothetical protein ACRRTK_002131 [Alexandromys fortis]
MDLPKTASQTSLDESSGGSSSYAFVFTLARRTAPAAAGTGRARHQRRPEPDAHGTSGGRNRTRTAPAAAGTGRARHQRRPEPDAHGTSGGRNRTRTAEARAASTSTSDHVLTQAHALDYHNPAGFNCKDETEFRNFIVWLEDQKIRHYKIEDRGNLRNIHSSDWPKFFEKYLRDVNCPFKIQERQEAIDWLLGLAVRLEYGDNAEKYKDLVPDNRKNTDDTAKNAEPLINLDAGVMALANLLQIQCHDDYLVMLKAIRILGQERLTQDAVAKANQTKEGLPVALDKHILGFDTGDAVLNEAAQILRLLHIEELRELQTKINEAIVAVQAIIADPKTDHRLGKLGR